MSYPVFDYRGLLGKLTRFSRLFYYKRGESKGKIILNLYGPEMLEQDLKFDYEVVEGRTKIGDMMKDGNVFVMVEGGRRYPSPQYFGRLTERDVMEEGEIKKEARVDVYHDPTQIMSSYVERIKRNLQPKRVIEFNTWKDFEGFCREYGIM